MAERVSLFKSVTQARTEPDKELVELFQIHCGPLAALPLHKRIATINAVRAMISECSPFKNEPVDCVYWIDADKVHANDYNPNSVAPPEMELLGVSIQADGFTQPIVTMPDSENAFEVVDGFHRNRVGKENTEIREKLHGYLPIVQIRAQQADKGDRMASTVRHNRARGKHRVDAMSDIVLDLRRRNWSDDKIAKNLGMEPDEVLRLAQISGIAILFADREFSEAWETDEPLLETLEAEEEIETDLA